MTTDRYTVADLRKALDHHKDDAELLVVSMGEFHLMQGIESPESAANYYAQPTDDVPVDATRPVIEVWTGARCGLGHIDPDEAAEARRRANRVAVDRDVVERVLNLLDGLLPLSGTRPVRDALRDALCEAGR